MKKKTEPKGWNILCTCRGQQEHYDMLGIIVYLQSYYRKLKLFKKKTWFKDNDDLHSWAEKAIKQYKKLQTDPFDIEKRRKDEKRREKTSILDKT